MTEGSPLKALFVFAMPLFSGYILTAICSAVDTSILGKVIGNDALATSSASSLPVSVISVLIAGITASMRIHLSYYFGSGDSSLIKKYILNGIVVTTAVSVVFCGGVLIFIRPILTAMKTPAEIYELSVIYAAVSLASLVLTYLYDALLSVLRAAGRGNTLMAFTAIGVALKIIYDILFVIVLQMGIIGILVASILQTVTGGIICLAFIMKTTDFFHFMPGKDVFDLQISAKIFKTGLPLGIQSAVINFGGIILQTGINEYLGTDYISALAVSGQLVNWLINPIVLWSMAVSVYCGQNYGAGKYDRILKGIKASIVVCAAYSVICIIISYFASYSVASLFTDRSDILSDACEYNIVTSFFYPLVAILAVFRDAIQGIGRSFLSMFGGVCELAANCFAGLVLIPALGKYGAIFANPVAWVMSSTFFTISAIAVLRKLPKISEENRRRLKSGDCDT